jgi:hypothetical protein
MPVLNTPAKLPAETTTVVSAGVFLSSVFSDA